MFALLWPELPYLVIEFRVAGTITSRWVSESDRGKRHMPRVSEPDPSQGLEQYIGNQVQEARLARAKVKFEGHDWSQTFLAARAFVSQSRISEVETGKVPPDRGLAQKLEVTLGLPRDSLVNLIRILEQATVRDYAKPFLRRQEEASMIHAVGLVVPGLLQTPDYARELMLSGQAGDPTDIDSYVDQRMARQRVWERSNPPWMSAVLDEGVLHKATLKQLERLLQAQETPNVSIQVLPSGAGHIMGTLYILTHPDGARGAYTEGFDIGNYSEDVDTVLRFQKVYDRLAASALTTEVTTDRINEALKRSK
ncbi:Scr1 family TA system antitoxin-like transcriptional regulator [Streptomyces sp. NPDC050485]|uniref:helix-turn-helix domain-containing protein n=1 Tax=Streptomyces sp. NPDC050485 TaxID=3365617 RepID=UPI0037975D59